MAQAQPAAFPSKPLRVIVPFTPGGSTDILARAIAPRIALPDQTVQIDNKPGAGGSLGADIAAHAEADGHTLLMGHIGTLAVNVSLYPKLAYDPLKSFVPVAGVSTRPWPRPNWPSNSPPKVTCRWPARRRRSAP